MMNARDTLGVLSSQSGGRGHGIAHMSSNHFLVSFQSAGPVLALMSTTGHKLMTDAPPELSEPAMTSIRLVSIFIRILVLVHNMLCELKGITQMAVGVIQRKESETVRVQVQVRVRHEPHQFSARATISLAAATSRIYNNAGPLKHNNIKKRDKSFIFTKHTLWTDSNLRWPQTIL